MTTTIAKLTEGFPWAKHWREQAQASAIAVKHAEALLGVFGLRADSTMEQAKACYDDIKNVGRAEAANPNGAASARVFDVLKVFGLTAAATVADAERRYGEIESIALSATGASRQAIAHPTPAASTTPKPAAPPVAKPAAPKPAAPAAAKSVTVAKVAPVAAQQDVAVFDPAAIETEFLYCPDSDRRLAIIGEMQSKARLTPKLIAAMSRHELDAAHRKEKNPDVRAQLFQAFGKAAYEPPKWAEANA
ncbi:MAG: hypothetical protein MUF80_06705 [Burkholderiales bacterium]|jgi:hypothetical protein|nr:hypothetical protein [Burkholderiales bacterium]